jgi:hypothetical protein
MTTARGIALRGPDCSRLGLSLDGARGIGSVNLVKIGLAGHLRGNKVLWTWLRDEPVASALFAIDPVDGTISLTSRCQPLCSALGCGSPRTRTPSSHAGTAPISQLCLSENRWAETAHPEIQQARKNALQRFHLSLLARPSPDEQSSTGGPHPRRKDWVQTGLRPFSPQPASAA